ncbi:enoyl-CoA hydratase/isomerase family protein [Comamonas kerstersii]|uniref:Enoyl-CoA hydratase n=2 Tax=Comamonas kerstersii TaxID=225992 RepID=A0A1V3TII6_9BURK|nr:enoyl-CoA hydratase/isomerase family protein [Comamonas kerstersii]AQZ98811.1 enoyl-CoA hydratase [Comamonas kerstersii]KAB0587839.1 enoyl-CoA hydratase/isomerase family protein [Comamonas kerstersii]OOH85878.1 enoyl-CoA hydratase [Comamonas kerstersii]OOH92872.1 enoyl-CoA hydratase [Comamonas kerstersii]
MSVQVTAMPWQAAQGDHTGIWLVEIANPDRRNAMTRSMWRQLRTVFLQLQHNMDVRCVVLKGQGLAFCAGGDISEYPGFRFDAQQLAGFHEQDVWGGLQAMLDCDVPVVAAITGACMGAGVEMACCSDIRVVTEHSKFGAPIAKLGFPMAPKELALVARSVGEHTAKRMLLEAAVFSAQEMAALGWCAAPVAEDLLEQYVVQLAQRIASLAPQAARLNKQTMRHCAAGTGMPDPYGYAATAEHREGIAAFLEKRKPRF